MLSGIAGESLLGKIAGSRIGDNSGSFAGKSRPGRFLGGFGRLPSISRFSLIRVSHSATYSSNSPAALVNMPPPVARLSSLSTGDGANAE
jgi:hypothetical protein